jgi:hypothetical protein
VDSNLITVLLASELIARRSPAVDSSERRNLSFRSLALASVGAPPELAIVDTQNRVRSLERTLPSVPVPTGPALGFQAAGRRIARDLRDAADSAQTQLEKTEEALKANEAGVKEQKKALEEAKKQAEQLEGCAVAVGEVFQAD